ncbi:MAG: hypothetical protein K6F46_00240 [Desulfovibrio sp.]|nr:hypothetical protein [Desulfovibrio sp.]
MLAKRTTELTSGMSEQAWGVIKQLSADEQERAEAEAVEKARRDMVARIRSAEMKGQSETRLAIATKMLRRNIPIDDICELTGLSSEEVSALVHNADFD